MLRSTVLLGRFFSFSTFSRSRGSRAQHGWAAAHKVTTLKVYDCLGGGREAAKRSPQLQRRNSILQ